MTLLPLTACGGGGSSGGGGGGATTTPPPAPALPAEFIENPSGVFIARDDRDTSLDQSDATADLTVTGKGGNDDIETGSGNDTINGGNGNDIIRAGEGIDIINGGAGNDAIVLVGTTTAGEYTSSAITNSGGSGTNLSEVLTLAYLNDRAVSEVAAGEIIDGGSGTNTLFIYGTVDLTGVTLNNLTVLVVNSDVTLTPEQIANFTTVDGNGNSIINIDIPSGSADNYILDLSTINVANIASININGDITVVIDNESDVDGIGTIAVSAGKSLNLEVNGNGANTVVDLGALGTTFSQVTSINIDSDVTVSISNSTDITNLGLTEITGAGDIQTNGSGSVETALNGITVSSTVNTIPNVVNDVGAAGENQVVMIDVLANDTDRDGDTLSILNASVGVNEGSVSIVGNQIRFDPETDFDYLDDGENTNVIISYTVTDGDKSDQGSLTITVSGNNDSPLAVDDAGTADENVIKAFDVVANDIDPDDSLNITSVSVPAGQGSVSIVDGKISFDPGTDFDDLATGVTEAVNVSYTISDGDVSDDGVLTITVKGINDAPVGITDTANADENEIISIDALNNDTDEENDALIISSASVDSGNGSVSIVGNEIRFDPGTDFDNLATGATEDIEITYTVSDGNKSGQGTVTVTVTGVNDAPTTVNDADEIFNYETSTVDVIFNDSDEEGSPLTLTNVSGPAGKGSVSIVGGEVFFDPGSDFDGLAPAETEDVEITYTVSDGVNSSDGTLVITVVGPNEPPVTVVDTASAGENETILVDVLNNDSDADGHTLSISGVSVVDGKGSVSVVDGKVQFDPGYDFDHLTTGQSEDVIITYKAYDGIDETEGTLTVTVNGDDDEPVAVNDTIEVIEGNFFVLDVLSNDYDLDGTIALTGVSSEIGSAYIYDDNNITYSTNAYFNELSYGETTEFDITYTIASENGATTGTVTVTVIGRNDDPETVLDFASVGEDGSVIIDVLSNDIDINGNTLYIYTASINENFSGILTIQNNQLVFDTAGDFNYMDANQSREIKIEYQVIDGFGGIDTGEVRVTVNGSSDTDTISIINYYDNYTDQYVPDSNISSTFMNVYLYRDTNISGWDKNDKLILGSGDDYVDGYDGADFLDGGLGFDYLGYYWSDAGVTVNLSTGFTSGGFATGDNINNFEGIDGSQYSDYLTGDNNTNSLFGNAGNDTISGLNGDDYIEGGAGADNLNGGDGIDMLSYASASGGVNINLSNGTVSGSDATGDTISGFEDIYGSAFNDVLTGDDNQNYLYGGQGVDFLNGAGGNDTFIAYESENSEQDHFNGGDGYDTIVFVGDDNNSDDPRYHISLSQLDATDIEQINIYGSIYIEILNFSAQDVIDITDENNTLAIFGGNNDIFQSYSQWDYVGDSFDGYFYYSTYTSGAATLHVYLTIPEDSMFLPVTGTFYETSNNIWRQADFEEAVMDKNSSTENLTVYANEYGFGEATITTGSGDDIVYLDDGTGSDYAYTGDGNDLIYLDFYDFVYGGDGIDTISFEHTVNGAGQYAYLDDPSNFKLNGIENIIGSENDDYLRGDESVNIIEGRLGDDTIFGTAGADVLDGGEGIDTISYKFSNEGVTLNLLNNTGSGGYAGDNTFLNFENINGSNFADILTGDDNQNTIQGLDGNDEIYGSGGNDRLYGNNDNDLIFGGDDDDIIFGGFGNDELNGGDGNDQIHGTNGNNTKENDNDILNGNAGNDKLYGEHGDDTINGGDGDDYVDGGLGNDILDGGNGIDTLDYIYSLIGMDINLLTGTASANADDTDSINDFENIKATIYSDTITGNNEDNIIVAWEGDDTIFGHGGNDEIYDGRGLDTVYGGDGDDIIHVSGDSDTDLIYGEAGNDEIYIYYANDLIDGGDDIDTLRLDNYYYEILDLSEINASNIEKINTPGNKLDTINFTIQDILDVTDSNNILQFEGVNYSLTSTGQGWVQGADQVIDTETYHTYTAGGATLLIDTDITQDIT